MYVWKTPSYWGAGCLERDKSGSGAEYGRWRPCLGNYHRILKCFVLIDLKKEEASYEDVGQMNMYLGYFENEQNTAGDNAPIGIVLAREKDDLLIKYALHGISTQLFVSKYQLYLSDKEELRKEVVKIYTIIWPARS